MAPGETLESLLGAFMDVEEPELQVEHRLSGHAEAEVPRLDDPRVNGAHGNLKDPFPGHGTEGMELALHAGDPAVVREVLVQRPGPLGPVVVEGHAHGVRVPFWRQAEEVHDLAFEPVRHRMLRGDRRETRLRGVHARVDAQEGLEAWHEPDMMEYEAAGPHTFVGGEEGRQPSPQGRGPVGDERQPLQRGLADELAGIRLEKPRQAQLLPEGSSGGAHTSPSTTRTAARMSSSSGSGR